MFAIHEVALLHIDIDSGLICILIAVVLVTEFFGTNSPSLFGETLELRLHMVLGSISVGLLARRLAVDIPSVILLLRGISLHLNLSSTCFLLDFQTLQLVKNFE